ncbi:hypothetical protein FJN17_34655 [Bradyrhizobium symbiodeficiens]|uniref:Uncharacterized protein n=1 Tax=Bradyrhizobium symbiodeficiens TaxID=1404367 RepID=A0ABZ2F0H2_9BRAD
MHDALEWQAAMEALLLVAERGGPVMFARIGMMLALNGGTGAEAEAGEALSDRRPRAKLPCALPETS